jgi:hypothetical protein
MVQTYSNREVPSVQANFVCAIVSEPFPTPRPSLRHEVSYHIHLDAVKI